MRIEPCLACGKPIDIDDCCRHMPDPPGYQHPVVFVTQEDIEDGLVTLDVDGALASFAYRAADAVAHDAWSDGRNH